MAEHVVELTDANFEQEVLKSNVPVLVDFWAQWCGPCLAVAPVLKQLAEEYGDKVKIAKLDIDANQETANQFSIMSIPTMLFFKGGQIVDKQVGALPKPAIAKKLDSVIA